MSKSKIEQTIKSRNQRLSKAFGMWKDRKEEEFKRINSRYGKVLD